MTDQSPKTIVQPEPEDTAEEHAAVSQPAKLMRIGGMVRQMLEEVRSAPLDTDGRKHLRGIYERSVVELKDVLSPELSDELDAMTIPFGQDVPTESELRIAQAQLMGWLEGLFQGIQAAFMAQQAQAHAQLDQLRKRALEPPDPRTGHYL